MHEDNVNPQEEPVGAERRKKRDAEWVMSGERPIIALSSHSWNTVEEATPTKKGLIGKY